MKAILAFLPYAYPTILLLALYYLQLQRAYIWYFNGGVVVLYLLVWLSLVRPKNINQEQLLIALSPVLFLFSSLAFYVLTDSLLLQRVQLFIVAVGFLVYLRALYFFHWHSVKYQPGSLQTQTRYMNIISVFFLSTFLYSLETFLNVPLWLLAGVMFVFLALLQGQHLFLKHKSTSEYLYSLVFVFIITQYFVAIGFLPFLILVKGFMFLAGYFLFYQLFKGTVKGLWRPRLVTAQLAATGLLLIFILFITKWF